MQYSDIEKILKVIPEATRKMALLIRHSESVQEGEQHQRTLSSAGRRLCQKVLDFYTNLVHCLARTVGFEDTGVISYSCSEFPRAELTLWEILHPEQIIRNKLLCLIATLKKVNGGNWYKKQKAENKTVPEITRAFFDDPTLWEGQPFNEYKQNYLDWVTGGEAYVNIGTAHEVGCSLAAGDYLPDDVEPGLEECQSYLFCMDHKNNIIAVLKITPPGTEPEAKE